MKILLGTLIPLAAAFVFHLVWWRIRLPQRQLRALLVIFGVFFVAALALYAMQPGLVALAGAAPWISWLYVALFYWAAAFCYVITYSAMEGDSPTLSLTRHLHGLRGSGMDRAELEEFFRQRPFIGARVKALMTDGILLEHDGGYRLAPGGYVFFRTILGYRRIVFGKIKDGG